MTNEQYYSFIGSYKDAQNILLTRLEAMNHSLYDKEQACPIHDVQYRIKDKRSIEDKLGRQKLTDSLKNAKNYLMDIAGIRVICYFVNDVYNLVKALKIQTDLIVIREKDYIEQPKPNGYRSYHIILGVPVYGMASMEYFPIEIQIRTMAMDLWASMEHRICYKKERPDKAELERQLIRYAAMLERLEKKFEKYNEVDAL